MYFLPNRRIFQLRQQFFSHSTCITIIGYLTDGDIILRQGCLIFCKYRLSDGSKDS